MAITLGRKYNFPLFFMPEPTDKIESLAHQFESLGERLKECRNPQERMVLLRRMRLVIDTLDRMVLAEMKAEITGSAAVDLKNPRCD